jgi:flagellar basal-body rod protein FlgB
MVDLISTRTIDMTKLALDGLMTRQKAIAANTANVVTPGYQRKDVQFEDQLREIVDKDDLKEYIKGQNSQNNLQYNPTSLDLATDTTEHKGLTPQQAKYLQTNIYSGYEPQIVDDTVSGGDATGNNVDMEKEVTDMATVGLRYNVLADLEQKQLKIISNSIKGDGS